MKKIIAIMSILLMLLTSISIAFAEETTTDATSEATATEITATEPATTETEAETSTDVGETATEEVSITPDSPLWGVKLAIEKIDLALTFNRAAKSEKGLKYARLRLLEVEKMMKRWKNIKISKGPKKGLGAAYVRAMTYAVQDLKAEVMFEMDADFFHDPHKR